MRVAIFSTKSYDEEFLSRCNAEHQHDLVFVPSRLSRMTVELATGCQAICAFVNDPVDADVLERLSEMGIHLVALRSAGFNHVDLAAAAKCEIKIVRVPAYSPYSVAEHTVGMMLCLNRKFHRAYSRVRDNNFSLEGLLGFDFHGKTVGIVGTGKIGEGVARIMNGFGCQLLAHDVRESEACLKLGIRYVDKPSLLADSDIVTLHCPLIANTYHLIDDSSLKQIKRGAMLINTSRGGLVDTKAVIKGLKSGQLSSLGIDVYEEEGDLFFEDFSDQVVQDDVFSRLLTFPNVLITGHQAFFTDEALTAIARTTLQNITEVEKNGSCENEVAFKPSE